jgi:para-nitrobenzyl esterase
MRAFSASIFKGLVLSAIVDSTFALLTNRLSINTGRIVGNPRDSGKILSFKGIPYARPPINELRWKPPQPLLPWNDTFNATTFGFTCWNSLVDTITVTAQNEDCLTVNVWTGAQKVNDSLPVMVWVYGGGFVFGQSGDPSYDGTKLAQKGVVVVHFNYRMNAFGFLAHPELDIEGQPSGNFGLQDIQAVLKWVQENIASFGGDASRVTVFGESAGAHAIGLLMASPLSKSLFHQAIMESGSWWDNEHGSLMTFDLARQNGTAFALLHNATSADDLRSIPAAIINSSTIWSFETDPSITAFTPSLDSYVLPAIPAEVFDLGLQMKIPIMAGWNTFEGFPFVTRAIPHATSLEFRTDAEAFFHHQTREFLDYYPGSTDAEANASALALIGDLAIGEQTWEIVDTQSRSGAGSVYLYHLTYTSPYMPASVHGSDIPFVFGNLIPTFANPTGAPANEEDQQFSDAVMAYWTNFAKDGNPNGPTGSDLPTWPEYGGDGAHVLGLGTHIAPIDVDFSRFHFIKSLRHNGIFPAAWRNINVLNLA